MHLLNLMRIGIELASRLARSFLPHERGERTTTKRAATVAGAPVSHDYLDGETCRRLGASRQIGRTGPIANTLERPSVKGAH